jgi:hypothetical protein
LFSMVYIVLPEVHNKGAIAFSSACCDKNVINGRRLLN